MRVRHFGGLMVLGVAALLLGGCVYVPSGPYGPGYYAPAPVVVPAPIYGGVYVAPRAYYRHHHWPYRHYGY